MKIVYSLVLLFVSIIAKSETPLEMLIHQAELSKSPFYSARFFHPFVETNKTADSYAAHYSLYQIPNEQLQQLIATNSRNIQLSVSLNGKDYSLKLTRMNILAADFEIKTSDSDKPYIDHSKAVYYRGIVEGTPNSLATVSIFENDVMAVFSTPEEGNFVLGKIGENSSTEYILYNDKDLKIENPFRCVTNDETYKPKYDRKSGSSRDSRTVSCRAITMYYEANYKLYQAKSSNVTTTSNFIKAMFNSIATIYYNEEVNMKISEIYVWTTPDSYSTTDAGDALDRFTMLRGSTINENLGQLLSSGAGGLGGIAWLDVLCSNNRPVSFVGIANSFQNFPTYSWNIEAMSHETGHNIASPHTHNCWAWDNGPIDWCGPTADADYTEGGCSAGPLPTKGTVMSYCHLVPSIGINLSLGFGQEPGDLIRSATAQASCVTEQEPFISVLTVDTNLACVGSDIYMEVNPFDDMYFFYQWYRGSTLISSATNSYQATESGTYRCLTTDSNGCIATSNSVVLSFIAPHAEIQTSLQPLCKSDTATLTAVGGSLVYLWSTGDSVQSILVSDIGTYVLTVSDSTGCSANTAVTLDKSNCFSGISETTTIDLRIYPNPANDVLTLESSAIGNQKTEIIVHNVAGQIISVNSQQQGDKILLQTAGLASGMYILHFRINENSINRRFVKL